MSIRSVVLIAVAAVAAACGGPTTDDVTTAAVTTDDRAVEIARAAAVEEGIAVHDYALSSVERDEAGSYWVTWELPPPTPPGGHFSVRVMPDGSARVHHGE